MLLQLRTYRPLTAGIALMLLLGMALPLVREICAPLAAAGSVTAADHSCCTGLREAGSEAGAEMPCRALAGAADQVAHSNGGDCCVLESAPEETESPHATVPAPETLAPLVFAYLSLPSDIRDEAAPVGQRSMAPPAPKRPLHLLYATFLI